MTQPNEPVAWRVRRLSDDPEEWQLRPAGAALDFGNPKRWEIQPLYAHPARAHEASADTAWVDEVREHLDAIIVFARDSLDNGHLYGGDVGNVMGIRDEAIRLGEKMRRMERSR